MSQCLTGPASKAEGPADLIDAHTPELDHKAPDSGAYQLLPPPGSAGSRTYRRTDQLLSAGRQRTAPALETPRFGSDPAE